MGVTELPRRFWEGRPLDDLNDDEWEALCDGCGRCCLNKLQHPETDEVVYTDVACRLLDLETCRCRAYPSRRDHVPGCADLRTAPAEMLRWLPVTCAYRRLHEGKSLPSWHPLLTGDPGSVQRAGMSVCAWALSESEVPEELLPDHIVDDPALFE